MPKRFVILGGGSIGCELAQCFARFGSKVTIVEKESRIMTREDADVSEMVREKFLSENISVLVGHKAVRVGGLAKVLFCDNQGLEVQIDFDEILVAAGSKANIEGFGLERLGLKITERGTVAADEYLRTTKFPNIYVMGMLQVLFSLLIQQVTKLGMWRLMLFLVLLKNLRLITR